MHTPIKCNTCVSDQVAALHARWGEVQKGLRLVMFGYFCLLLIAIPGLVLLQVGKGNLPLLQQIKLNKDDAVVLGTGLSYVGGIAGIFLLLVGQWQCLGYA